MKVQVHQTRPFGFDKTFIKKLFAHIARSMPRYASAEVSVAFVSDKAITTLNKKYRKKNEPTDVLSFAERDSSALPRNVQYLGEIVVAYPYARRQAGQLNRSIRAELAILLTHGFLHLVGHDHHHSGERKRMEKMENKILRTYSVTKSVKHHANT